MQTVVLATVTLCFSGALCLGQMQTGPHPAADRPIVVGDGAMIASMTAKAQLTVRPPRLVSQGVDALPAGANPTVIQADAATWHYYAHGQDGLVYASSTDSLTWTVHRDVLRVPRQATGGFSPFLDRRSGVTAEQHYKALGGRQETGLYALVSADGRSWRTLKDQPVLCSDAPQAFYGRQAVLWDAFGGQYVAFWSEHRNGQSRIVRAVSDDFNTWSNPEPLALNIDGEDIWSATVFAVDASPPLLVMLLTRTLEGQAAPADVCLATSRDGGRTFHRPMLEAWLRPAAGEDWRAMTPSALVASGTRWTKVPEDFFLAAGRRYHVFHNRLLACTAQPLKTEFAGTRSDTEDLAEIITHPFVVTGNALELNASTDAMGGLLVEILDEQGQVIPGYDRDRNFNPAPIWVDTTPQAIAAAVERKVKINASDLHGDGDSMRVCWRLMHRGIPRNESRTQLWPDWSISDLKGRVVRLRLIAHGMELFSWVTVDRPPQEGALVIVKDP